MTKVGRKQERFGYGLLIVGILVMLASVARGQESSAESLCESSQTDCRTCISAHPNCTWCGEVDAESTIPTFKKRCMLYEDNVVTCGKNDSHYISNPKSSFVVTADEPFTVAGPDFFKDEANTADKVKQLRPQRITVRLRPGQPQKVNVTFKKVIDYPLDIYYVMDLSNSMKDDLETLQRLGTQLFDRIEQNITENIQLGFGSFVDKVMMPFASTVDEQLRNPCAKQETDNVCAPAFGFRHQLNITNNREEFAAAINATKISGNIDSPEGSFDALMQIAVCEHIQWREGATHVILLTTDATPHLAMDGKLAAILEANDMQCHMEWGYNTLIPHALMYSKSKTMDYPSLGQLKKVFGDNKIKTIFAVTENVLDIYERMRDVLGGDAYAARLDSDSSNIIPLIKDTYDQIKGRLELSKPVKPDHVQVTYRVLCPNATGWKEDSLLCDNIQINDTVEFEFVISTEKCPSDPNQVDEVVLKSSSLQDEVKIRIEYLCDCDCASGIDTNSTRCSNHGNLTCGVCECDPGREGSLCQCDSMDNGTHVSEWCKRDRTNNIYCENNGRCECGECRCNEPFYGKYCQCKTTGCGSHENGICGGPKNGVCQNCDNDQKCNCIEEYGFTIRDADGTCTCHVDLCKEDETDSVPCNGRGDCHCDTCICNNTKLYSGEYCENCIHPECTGLRAQCDDQTIRNCATCLYDADYKGKASSSPCTAECGNRFLTYDYVAAFFDCSNCEGSTDCLKCEKHSTEHPGSDICEIKQNETDCNAKYKIVWLTTSQYVVYVKRFDKVTDCPQPIDAMLIVLPVIGVIILIGLVLLAVWKVVTTLRDKIAYDEFEKEAKNRKWTQGENPIFTKPSTNFANPTFAGND